MIDEKKEKEDVIETMLKYPRPFRLWVDDLGEAVAFKSGGDRYQIFPIENPGAPMWRSREQVKEYLFGMPLQRLKKEWVGILTVKEIREMLASAGCESFHVKDEYILYDDDVYFGVLVVRYPDGSVDVFDTATTDSGLWYVEEKEESYKSVEHLKRVWEENSEDEQDPNHLNYETYLDALVETGW